MSEAKHTRTPYEVWDKPTTEHPFRLLIVGNVHREHDDEEYYECNMCGEDPEIVGIDRGTYVEHYCIDCHKSDPEASSTITRRDPCTSSTRVAVVDGNPTSGEIHRKTAEFIVRACNAHDDLLAACELGLRYVPVGEMEGDKSVFEIIYAAIRKGEGKQ